MPEPPTQILNIQPQSEEAEQAVLGSMLASKDAVSKTIAPLSKKLKLYSVSSVERGSFEFLI